MTTSAMNVSTAAHERTTMTEYEQRGPSMNVKMDHADLEEAVVMWLERKHGISTTKAPAGSLRESRTQWSAIYNGTTEIAVNVVSVTIANVHGVPPSNPSSGPYRTSDT
jgi:hypothetical protein